MVPIEFTPFLQHHLGLVPGSDAYQQEPLGSLHCRFVHGPTGPEETKEEPKPWTLPGPKETKQDRKHRRTTEGPPNQANGVLVRRRTLPVNLEEDQGVDIDQRMPEGIRQAGAGNSWQQRRPDSILDCTVPNNPWA